MLKCVPSLDRKTGNACEEGKKTETPARQTKREGVLQLVRREEISITAIWTSRALQAHGKLTHT